MSLMNLQRMVLNVSDPEAAANWYRLHLGMKDSEPVSPDARAVCLSTPERVVLIELWTHRTEHFARQQFRRAFPQCLVLKVPNPLHEVFRLLSAGAQSLGKTDEGLTLTDPFGLQLIVTRETIDAAA